MVPGSLIAIIGLIRHHHFITVDLGMLCVACVFIRRFRISRCPAEVKLLVVIFLHLKLSVRIGMIVVAICRFELVRAVLAGAVLLLFLLICHFII